MLINPIVVLLFLGIQPDGAGERHLGFCPQGTPAELSDFNLLARLRDPRVQAVSFSSFDRTGGNNDGFQGTYSRLRLEGGDSVLAEATGPGIIQRLWFTHTSGERPGLLDGKQEHLKVYLDQGARPVIDAPLESIFSGRHPGFPAPLVMEGSGGFVSYVPIPFQNGCKVVVEGQGVRFYQINLITLPPGAPVETYTDPPAPERLKAIESAAELWRNPERFLSEPGTGADHARYVVDTMASSELRYSLRAGPATIRSLSIRPAAGFEAPWRAARLRIQWDAHAPGAAVDVPIGHAFGWADGAIPCRSLLVGERDGAWYNRFPMPYQRQAIVTINTERPLKGVIEVRSSPGVVPDAGYFRANFQHSPLQPGKDFSWLSTQGRGHFAGVFLMTEGKAKLPYWLEGDDRFRIDGRLAIHGTGSEDYFNCGWYALAGRLDGPASYPVHGFPVYRRVDDGWQAAAYRWHLADPVPFAQSIESGIEHGGDNKQPADYRAVVYWYSNQPGPAVAPQP